MKEIPEHVSWRVIDAWRALPPCTPGREEYCHVDCPYFYECYPQDTCEEEEEDEIHDGY